jgi:hypothetical protein
MDNGEIEVFNAYRVQHNNSRGPYKVGPRTPEAADADALTGRSSGAPLPRRGACATTRPRLAGERRDKHWLNAAQGACSLSCTQLLPHLASSPQPLAPNPPAQT